MIGIGHGYAHGRWNSRVADPEVGKRRVPIVAEVLDEERGLVDDEDVAAHSVIVRLKRAYGCAVVVLTPSWLSCDNCNKSFAPVMFNSEIMII